MSPPMMFLSKIPGFPRYYYDVRDGSIWSAPKYRFHKKFTGWKRAKLGKDKRFQLYKPVKLTSEQVKQLILRSRRPKGGVGNNRIEGEAEAGRGLYEYGHPKNELSSRAERGVDRRYKRHVTS